MQAPGLIVPRCALREIFHILRKHSRKDNGLIHQGSQFAPFRVYDLVKC